MSRVSARPINGGRMEKEYGTWENLRDPREMVEALLCDGKLSDRKARLYAAAVWRGRSSFLSALEIGDKSLTAYQVPYAAEFLADEVGNLRERFVNISRSFLPLLPNKKEAARRTSCPVAPTCAGGLHRAHQVAVLCEMVGNPWDYPLPSAYHLLSSRNVQGVAHAAYEDRLDDGRLDPILLGVLADAVEEVLGSEEECPLCGGMGEVLVCDLGKEDPTLPNCCPMCEVKEEVSCAASQGYLLYPTGCGLIPSRLLAHLRLPPRKKCTEKGCSRGLIYPPVRGYVGEPVHSPGECAECGGTGDRRQSTTVAAGRLIGYSGRSR